MLGYRVAISWIGVVAFIATGLPGNARAGSFVANFTCKYDLGRALQVFLDANEAYTFGKGSLVLSQKAGAGNDEISASTTFTVSGDFTATVSVSRSALGNAYVGLVVGDQYQNALMDIFYASNNGLYSNVFNLTGGGVTTYGGANSSTNATFTISRSGNVLTSGYNSGSGFNVVANSPDLGGYGVPVTVGLFLIEENGDTGAHQGSFSALNVSADSLGKTCRSPGL